ncbi:MAG: zf-HC2 domain-containing protein [Candidatus Eremiobacteraeota bacterium]|nr:zf-HC2 domain-containing protein [Candidatus Eremiobacteraeota bacterium]
MKCSACRERLPAYQDGVLAAGAVADLEAHLASCEGCRAFAEEMMIVEHRLARLSTIEPRADFTQAVMQRISALPAPATQPRLHIWWLGVYDALAWVVVALLAATGFLRWKTIVAEGGVLFGKLALSGGALYRIADHFHLTTLALFGGLIEGAVLLALLYAGRHYLAGVRTAALSGAHTS